MLKAAPVALAGRVQERGIVFSSRDEPRRVRWASLTARMFHDFRIHEERSARERLACIAAAGR